MVKKSFIFSFCILFISLIEAKAQDDTRQLMQIDSSLIYINGEGTFLSLGKADGTKLNLLTTIQTGVQYNRLDSTSGIRTSNRMSLNLARISLSATSYKNRLSVAIVSDLIGQTPILEGWVGFTFMNKSAKIILGQKQTNTNNRLAMADERYSQLLGQSISGKSDDGIVYGALMKNFVGATREGGIFLETNFGFKKFKVYPSFSITTGEGQNFFNAQPNVGFKYGGRLDLLPFGDFIKNNAFIAHDIYHERTPKFAIGFAASLNVKASSSIGSENGKIFGIYNSSGLPDYANYKKLVADMVFKYKGFALIGEFINGSITGKDLFTNTLSSNKFTENIASASYNLGSAYNIQTSYIFKNHWAIDGRFSTIIPEIKIANSIVQNQNWYSFGVNKFIKNNAVKIGLNTTYINNISLSVPTKKWIGNIAVQILM